MHAPADWQLPRGVAREVWNHLHDSTVARRYDESLTGTPLLDVDRQFVERHCSMPGRVIDLGCGTGRIAIPLARLGHALTAVDLSEQMLRMVGEKVAAVGVRVNRVLANIVELDGFRDAQFDCALCMFATLGMVAGDAARRRVIDNAFRLLKPGGRFVLHVHARWHHLRTRTGRRWLLGDLIRSVRGALSAGDWKMAHHDGEEGWTMHLFTRGEVLHLMTAAGFQTLEVMPVAVDGILRRPWFFGRFRAYGFLIAARKPG